MEQMSTTNQNDVIEIDLKEVFLQLLSKVWLIVFATLFAGGLGLAVCYFGMTPQYKSTTSIYLSNAQNATSSSVAYYDAQLASQLTKDYEKLILGRFVLEHVIEELSLDMTYKQLYSKVSVKNVADTRIIDISVTDPNPKKAQIIADSVREAAAEHIKKVTNIEAVNKVDDADFPTSPIGPSRSKWAVMGAVAGFLASAGMIVLIYLLDDSIKTSDDVAKYLGLSTLAQIPEKESKKEKGKKARHAAD